MTQSAATIDLFAPLADVDRDVFGLLPLAGPVPDEVLAGLAKLATSPPIWGDDRLEWTELVAGLQAFPPIFPPVRLEQLVLSPSKIHCVISAPKKTLISSS
jgi:hypothetical protein